jgi:hypothetical protein
MAHLQPIDDSYDASSNTRLGAVISTELPAKWKGLGPCGKGDGDGHRSRVAENAGKVDSDVKGLVELGLLLGRGGWCVADAQMRSSNC